MEHIINFIIKNLNIKSLKNKNILILLRYKIKMGIGDWGLGIGDWAQSPIPNPQSPIFIFC